MIKKTYSEKLKNPLWQKKRLSVLKYANWRCQICGSKEKELHVHHSYYEKNKEPWEYDKNVMIAICDECHAKFHDKVDDNNELKELEKLIDDIRNILKYCKYELELANNNNIISGVCGIIIDEIENIEERYFNLYGSHILLAIEKYWSR